MPNTMVDSSNGNYTVLSSLRDRAITKSPQLYDELQSKGYFLLAGSKALWLGTKGGYLPTETLTILTYEESRFKQSKELCKLIIERTLTELYRMDLEQI